MERHEIDRQGMAFKAGSPLCSLHVRAGLTHRLRDGDERLFDYFEPRRGKTLERFSDRNEQSDDGGPNGNASCDDSSVDTRSC